MQTPTIMTLVFVQGSGVRCVGQLVVIGKFTQWFHITQSSQTYKKTEQTLLQAPVCHTNEWFCRPTL
jgi:hypothetical protein